MNKYLLHLYFTLVFLTSTLGLGSTQNLPHTSDNQLKTLEYHLPLTGGTVKFKIHSSGENMPLAVRIIDVLKSHAKPLFEYFDYIPRDGVHITIDNKQTVANGTAMVFPRNLINYFSHPPTGNGQLMSNESYIKVLVIHELVHIIHLDQTRGINQGLRTVFGSAGKLMPSVVPTWFSEGIATWAETKFSSGGRGRSSVVQYELERSLMDPKFCSQIGCLDNPGIYPYYSSAYWIGADFLGYLEKEIKGSISCLVKQNSASLAFFLNRAFISCLGSNATTLFAKYRHHKMRQLERRYAKLLSRQIMGTRPIDLKTRPLLTKDFRVLGGKVYYIDHNDRIEKFNTYDLRSGKYRMQKIAPVVTNILPPSPYSRDNNEILLSTSDYHRMRFHRRIYSLDDDKLPTEILDRKQRAEYAFRQNKQKTIFLKWDKINWEIRSYNQTTGKNLLLYKLPPMFEVSNLRMYNSGSDNWLSFKVYRPQSGRPHQLWAYPIKQGAIPYVLYSSAKAFRYMERCEGQHLIHNLDQSRGNLVGTPIRGHITTRQVHPILLNEIAMIRWDERDTVMLLKGDPLRGHHLSRGCRHMIKLLKPTKEKTVAATKFRSKKQANPKHIRITNYPKLSHFYPKWWFITYSGSDSSGRLSLHSSINDPKSRHQVDLELKQYRDVSSIAPRVEYTYKKDDNIVSTQFDQTLLESKVTGEKDKTTTHGITFARAFRPGALLYVPSISYNKQTVTDFISRRRIEQAVLSQSLSFKRARYEDFLQKTNTQVSLANNRVSTTADFLELNIANKTTIYLAKDLYTHIKLAYSKLYKDGLVGGTVFGGGQGGGIHNFYGIDYQEAFGNRLFSSRVQLDRLLHRPHKSWGLLPLYLQKVNLLAGIEHIRADWLRFYNTTKSESLLSSFAYSKGMTSYHTGLRFKTTIFYRAHISWDLLYTKTKNSSKGDNWRVAFFINATMPGP